ncbi:4-hydroxy-tetrahydrodipicolinate synthase [Desulfonema ishimotonii]|uniref:4-hydroxy-tetrahydrodipicolinate synthase n=1 Tax=Desulfonema ishimotonii TaxID=45657 RepID=A0A401FYE7_9BACT|nr:4-hydroxy-tetrahydrodipicolinate synthase [Desulfonema ishimotonii]GBC62032.1 4-hydroxy-tetrahydrodipicolinate synthase [Desulfonema ishimotonii]
MLKGAFTALITPFKGNEVDYAGLSELVTFQISNGISGILAVGTTGESPVLTWQEHNAVIEHVAGQCGNTCLCIAGTGSNNTREALEGTKHAAETGADAVLLVDPYYNGPSSLEIRREYVEPVARAFPDIQIIPYIIPGRTGAQMLPEDLAILSRNCKNVATVKEATGSLENMKRTRECCGPEFTILSGDDGLTYEVMTAPEIRAGGVISVVSNVAPKAVAEMVRAVAEGRIAEGEAISRALDPLFNLVVVKTQEKTPYGDVVCRARNPLAIKALMQVLGMPSGPCRPPLGRLTRNAMNIVLEAGRKVWKENPEILSPLQDAFGTDIGKCLNDPDNWRSLCYTEY